LVDRKKKTKEDSEVGPGALFSSGLIAGGAITGIIIAFMIGTPIGKNHDGSDISLLSIFNTGVADKMGDSSSIISILCFALLGFILYRFALRKEENTL